MTLKTNVLNAVNLETLSFIYIIIMLDKGESVFDNILQKS